MARSRQRSFLQQSTVTTGLDWPEPLANRSPMGPVTGVSVELPETRRFIWSVTAFRSTVSISLEKAVRRFFCIEKTHGIVGDLMLHILKLKHMVDEHIYGNDMFKDCMIN